MRRYLREHYMLQIILVAALTNLIGAVTCPLYFIYIAPPTFEAAIASPNVNRPPVMVPIFLFVSALSIGLYAFWIRPLDRWTRAVQAGQASSADVPVRIQRRALNLPFIIAGQGVILWILRGAFAGLFGFVLFTPGDLDSALGDFFGTTVVIGSATVTLTYLSVEAIWQRHLPRFFPTGHLSETPALRLPILIRLLAGLLLVSALPMILLGVLAFNKASLMVTAPNPAAVRSSLLILVFFLVGLDVAGTVVMAVFLSRTLVWPLLRMREEMARVEAGDLGPDRAVAVTSNDELGALCESFNHMIEGLRQRERLRDLFGRYVTPAVAAEVEQRGVQLGGETVEVTVLFADLRDFTGLAERLEPQELIETLNRFFTAMVHAVHAEGGTVNQFGGDSLLAIFGAPVPQPDHAPRAVRAAARMVRALADFNATQQATGRSILTMGVGLNTGPVVAGTVGAAERLEYTVIGDNVNLAQRLQALNRTWGTDVLLSAATAALIEEQVPLRDMGETTVKGRVQPVRVYSVEPIERPYPT